MFQKKIFYSNGKLLITAEYLVLNGATALALPTKFGQNLIVENGENQEIVWKSFDANGLIWFETRILFSEVKSEVLADSESEKVTLIKILRQAYLKNQNFIDDSDGYFVETHLTFPRIWGLGTSSTLINNIAQWTGVDAFVLLKNSFGGSGYDIACAQNDFPVLYTLVQSQAVVERVVFTPKCVEYIYFVYLNKKQNSRAAIADYYKNSANLDSAKFRISEITQSLIQDTSFENVVSQLQLHEEIMSSVLQKESVKSALFSDFDGAIKSLGAWGGDFVMVISRQNPTFYFKQKGYETILSYNEMIL